VLLLDARGLAVTAATPGQQLTLAVGNAGFHYAAVFTVLPDGTKELMWPRGSTSYGRISAGARVPLMQLEVTPGDVLVRAEFADEPRRIADRGEQSSELRLEVR
jgi:hypothetical protein